jgi:hypothetical protein
MSPSAPPSAPAERPAVGDVAPLLIDTVSTPRWFTGTDGRTQVAYELQLTNVVPAPLNLREVEVIDADSGATLLRLSGDPLLAATSLAATGSTPATTLPASSMGVVWLDVTLEGAPVPAAITHRLTVDPPADMELPGIAWTFTTAAVEIDPRSPVVLGQPLTGPRWAAFGSCCDGPHRRSMYPIDGTWYLAQRYAIDFNLLDAQNRPGSGDPRLPDSFPTFGQPVYAVAEGTVVVAVDDDPDLRVGDERDEPTPANAGGNRVILDIGDGRYAVYAHLQQDSVTVGEGDRVSRGQHIAAVGSSGTTGGPHLHFQVSDQPSVVFADGLPYAFDSFEVTGRTPPLDDVLRYYDTMEPIPLDTGDIGPHHDQLPLGRDVVQFPAIGEG